MYDRFLDAIKIFLAIALDVYVYEHGKFWETHELKNIKQLINDLMSKTYKLHREWNPNGLHVPENLKDKVDQSKSHELAIFLHSVLAKRLMLIRELTNPTKTDQEILLDPDFATKSLEELEQMKGSLC